MEVPALVHGSGALSPPFGLIWVFYCFMGELSSDWVCYFVRSGYTFFDQAAMAGQSRESASGVLAIFSMVRMKKPSFE